MTYSWGANPCDTAGYSQYTRGRLPALQYSLDLAQQPSSLTSVVEMYSYDIPGNVTGKRMQITMWGNDVNYGSWEQGIRRGLSFRRRTGVSGSSPELDRAGA